MSEIRGDLADVTQVCTCKGLRSQLFTTDLSQPLAGLLRPAVKALMNLLLAVFYILPTFRILFVIYLVLITWPENTFKFCVTPGS